MRFIKLLIISLALTFFVSCKDGQKIMELQNQITEIQNKYAPDKRVALVSFEAKSEDNKIVLKGETNLPDAKEMIINFAKEKAIDLTDSIKLLPDEKLGNKTFGLITVSVANLRAGYSHRAEMVTQALLGTTVKVLKQKAGFSLVQTPDAYIAWVDNSGVELKTYDEITNWNNAKKIIFTSEYGFGYKTTKNTVDRISDLVAGNIIEVVSKNSRHYKVKYPDGREAYVKSTDCLDYDEWIKKAKADKNTILNTAAQFTGVPYLWGGTSSKGLDCSGFTKTVYFLNGIVLPRDASQQVFTGLEVDTENSFENLEPGDLLFFGKKASKDKTEKITHVGIYIGDTEVIHASGMVKVNSLDKSRENFSSYLYDGYIRARRVLGSENQNGISLVSDHAYYNGDIK